MSELTTLARFRWPGEELAMAAIETRRAGAAGRAVATAQFLPMPPEEQVRGRQ